MEIILINWIVKVKVGIKDPFITTLVVQGKNKVMLLFMLKNKVMLLFMLKNKVMLLFMLIFCSVNEYHSEITVFNIL